MAQSPEANAARTEVIRYDRGWNAINAMLRAGRSLSGHERNCCFLNTGGKRFADVSGAAGLDFADDGRVLATADWDYDGDIDFWVANRSGPQVRYLRNNLISGPTETAAPPATHFVAIRLQGVDCNRDAVGARVTVEHDGNPKKSLQTVRAGEGYLAQSSKWLHFGLGKATSITRMTVLWPNGNKQVFADLGANAWYVIREGAEPEAWNAPVDLAELAHSHLQAPPVSDKARIVLLSPVPLPNLAGLDTNGEAVPLSAADGKAKLVNIWASWCQPCIDELSEWKEQAADLSAANLHVVALNVDPPEAQRDTLPAVVNKLDLPFTVALATEKLSAKFDVIQRSLLSRQRPLPVPSSFLIDGEGQLRAVYKGPVSVETLVSDAKLLTASPAERLAAATPFAGKWIQPPGGSTPLQLTMKLLDGGLEDEAEEYLDWLVTQNSPHLTASLTNLLGAIQTDKKEFKQAAASFGRSLQLDPNDRQAHIELGGLLLAAKQGKLAQPHFESALAATPNDPELISSLAMSMMLQREFETAERHFRRAAKLRPLPSAHWHLAEIAIGRKNTSAAIREYETALQLQPDLISKANNLAWLLATTTDNDLQDPDRAVQIAESVVQSDDTPRSQSYDTLAAAYAAAAQFGRAITAAETAARLAAKRNPAEPDAIGQRLDLYRQKKAYRESL